MIWRRGLLWLVLLVTVAAAEPVKSTVTVPMRDGVKLRADLYVPEPGRPWPVLLHRSPYDRKRAEAIALRYAAAGYAVLVQDCRGRFESEGAFHPYNNEGQDGYDTLDWIRKQPWSNGRVAMFGASYTGAVQWQAAVEDAPGLVALAPTATWTSFYRNLYLGGVIRLDLISGWTAGMAKPATTPALAPGALAKILLDKPALEIDDAIGWPIPWLDGFLAHPHPDGFWRRLDLTSAVEKLNLPAQHIVGYYDFFSRETSRAFQRLHRTTRNQQLILGPWDHGSISRQQTGDLDFGPSAALDVPAENIKWFDRFVKQEGGAPVVPVRYFSMGENVWRTSQSWPPSDARARHFYLHPKGLLAGDPVTSPTQLAALRADPANPVPAAAGQQPLWGPTDLASVLSRPDVATFRGAPMKTPLRIAGEVTAELNVSTDAPDGDWAVRLLDVHPNGAAYPVASGILRMSFRDDENATAPAEPGKRYVVRVDLGPTAIAFQPGHRIAVMIAPSMFPLYGVNRNTGKDAGAVTNRVALQKIFSGSRISLPEATHRAVAATKNHPQNITRYARRNPALRSALDID